MKTGIQIYGISILPYCCYPKLDTGARNFILSSGIYYMNWQRILIALGLMALIGIMLTPVGCLYKHYYRGVLPYSHTADFKLIESEQSDGTHLHITSYYMNSAMSIDNWEIVQEDDHIVVYVYMGYYDEVENGKGQIDIALVVPDKVNEVRFGEEKVLIWKRGVGVVRQ